MTETDIIWSASLLFGVIFVILFLITGLRKQEKKVKRSESSVRCPACDKRMEEVGIYEGPSGGACINVVCGNEKCRARLNISPIGIDLISRERHIALTNGRIITEEEYRLNAPYGWLKGEEKNGTRE